MLFDPGHRRGDVATSGTVITLRSISLVCLLLPSMPVDARAQAPLARWYGRSAILTDDAGPVAAIESAVVDVDRIEGWRAHVSVASSGVTLTGWVSPGTAWNGLYTRAESDLDFVSDGGFRVTLLARQWALISEAREDGLEVSFPEGLPPGHGAAPLTAPEGLSLRAIRASLEGEGPRRRPEHAIPASCELDLASTPGGRASFRSYPGAAWVDGREGSAERVGLEVRGFRAFGYRAPGACYDDGTFGPSMGHAVPREPPDVVVGAAVWVAADTELFATTDSTAPFGVLRARSAALALSDGRWLIYGEDDGTRWLAIAHLRASTSPNPAATLPRAASVLYARLGD